MPSVIAIVGASGAGKTTLLEHLVPELKRRGLRVGVIKHTHHVITVDPAGKDTRRYRDAGADAAMLAMPGRIALFRDASNELDGDPVALAGFLPDMDLVLAEGFKTADCPKIEVFRRATGKVPFYGSARLTNIIAIAGDSPGTPAQRTIGVPVFGFDDVAGLSEFILRHLSENRAPTGSL